VRDFVVLFEFTAVFGVQERVSRLESGGKKVMVVELIAELQSCPRRCSRLNSPSHVARATLSTYVIHGRSQRRGD
jgi:hypothetical protein